MIVSDSKYTSRVTGGECGFTMVELIVALFISGLVMAVTVIIYIGQSRNYSQLDDIANIQQDLRGALIMLPIEIRQAGCDPTESDIPGIQVATRNQFWFSMDNGGNPINNDLADGDTDDPGENVAFRLSAAVDSNGNGIVDNGGADWSGTGSLERNAGAGFEALADNIEAIEFNYILDDGSTSLTPPNTNNIRAVQISLLARAANPSQDYLNTSLYTSASGVVWNPPDDNFRRRLMITNIQLRNMGY